MTRRILIECGAAETRAALLVGDEVIRFWFGPARGDESLPRPPQPGDRFLGRVRSVSKPLAGAFVDLGEGPEGFLPFGKNAAPHEGAAVAVLVKRAAIGEKGPLLALSTEDAAAGVAAPARLGEPVDAALQAARALGAAEEISVDQPEALAALRGAENAPVAVVEKIFGDAEEALAASLERVVWLNAGARMIFDETEAVTAVDVDAGSAAHNATGRLNDKVNAAAADRLFSELSRRAVGGRVIVDFLPPSGADARQKLMEQIRAAKRGVCECRLGRLSVDGLFDLTAPRDGPSLLDRATEPAGEGWPRAGRRFTLDWQAKGAIRALEQALRSAPNARINLVAGEELGAYLMRYPQWLDRLSARFGARADIVVRNSLKERAFDVAESR